MKVKVFICFTRNFIFFHTHYRLVLLRKCAKHVALFPFKDELVAMELEESPTHVIARYTAHIQSI